jgi:hypothetical protein
MRHKESESSFIKYFVYLCVTSWLKIKEEKVKKVMFLVILSLLLLASFVLAENLGTLEEVLVPEMIQVSGDELYVLEGATIYVYSLKDLKLLCKFGQKGEGPGELKIMASFPNNFTVYPDYVFVQGFDKVIFFTKQGKLIREQRFNMITKILPLKEKFVIKTFPFEDKNGKTYWAIKLCDSDLKEIKELYRQEFPIQFQKAAHAIPMIADALNFQVYDEKIFIEESPKGFLIEVFDPTGKKLYQIDKKSEKIKVPEEYKKIVENHLKEDFLHKKVNFFVPLHIMEAGWDEFKKWTALIYPDYLPPIRDIFIDNHKIYVQTFKRQDNKQEYIIMDLKGNMIKKVYLPVVQPSTFASEMVGLGLKFCAIDKDRFVYLVENQEEEEWNVHVVDIK